MRDAIHQEQDIIEQLEALADQSSKRDQFQALLNQMPSNNAITRFYRAVQQYHSVVHAYHQENNEAQKRKYLSQAAKHISSAEKAVNIMLRKNKDSLSGQYLSAFMNITFSYDKDHNPVMKSSSNKWITMAQEQLKPLIETGFGPAIYQYNQIAAADESIIETLYNEGAKNGSVLCKAQLAQRYLSSVLNNANSDKPNPFKMPEGKSEQRFILDLKEAIAQGDYYSTSYLPRYLADICGALRGLAQAHVIGDRRISTIQVEKLEQLANIAKELSTTSGKEELSVKIDNIVRKARDISTKFKDEMNNIKSDPTKMISIKEEVAEKIIERLNKSISAKTAQLIKDFDDGKKETLELFRNHVRIKHQKSSQLTFLREIQNRFTGQGNTINKSNIESTLTRSEIEEHLKKAAEKKSRSELPDDVFNLVTNEVIANKAREACQNEYSELKSINQNISEYINTSFAKELTQNITIPRESISQRKFLIGSARDLRQKEALPPKEAAPLPTKELLKKISEILRTIETSAFDQSVNSFYQKYHPFIEKLGGIEKFLNDAKKTHLSSQIDEFRTAYQQATLQTSGPKWISGRAQKPAETQAQEPPDTTLNKTFSRKSR